MKNKNQVITIIEKIDKNWQQSRQNVIKLMNM
jgi:hypothetical protein